jgi:sRNA-binding carbon storage regulator CsrA
MLILTLSQATAAEITVPPSSTPTVITVAFVETRNRDESRIGFDADRSVEIHRKAARPLQPMLSHAQRNMLSNLLVGRPYDHGFAVRRPGGAAPADLTATSLLRRGLIRFGGAQGPGSDGKYELTPAATEMIRATQPKEAA